MFKSDNEPIIDVLLGVLGVIIAGLVLALFVYAYICHRDMKELKTMAQTMQQESATVSTDTVSTADKAGTFKTIPNTGIEYDEYTRYAYYTANVNFGIVPLQQVYIGGSRAVYVNDKLQADTSADYLTYVNSIK